MEDIIVPVVAMISVFGSIVLFIKILTDYWLRKRMVDKGATDENAVQLLKQHVSEGGKYGALKWGLIILFGSFGLIVINFLPYNYDYETSMPWGIFAFFLALGFLVYYFYVKRETEK